MLRKTRSNSPASTVPLMVLYINYSFHFLAVAPLNGADMLYAGCLQATKFELKTERYVYEALIVYTNVKRVKHEYE